MAEVLYLEISFLGFNDCFFLKLFRFFRRSLTPPFLKRELLISKHIIEIHAIKPSIF